MLHELVTNRDIFPNAGGKNHLHARRLAACFTASQARVADELPRLRGHQVPATLEDFLGLCDPQRVR